MKYYHVDVFSNKKFSGNGLTVFIAQKDLEKTAMQTLTQEMRQFESIFFYRINSNTFRAFIFTMDEELDFAGHPVLGVAAIIHDLYSKEKEQNSWTIELNAKPVLVRTIKKNNYYSVQMNQGRPEFGAILNIKQEVEFLSYLNLSLEDKYRDLPFQVVTTGLPYLILPIKMKALSKAKVTIPDLEYKLRSIGAKFFFVLDIENREGRTWDNLGLVEDIATGSAAGPVGAYLVKNGFEKFDDEIILKQGNFLGRPSELKIRVRSINNEINDVYVEGDVCKIAVGELLS